jgi:C4-dicarboxylate transporter, DctQ subunit
MKIFEKIIGVGLLTSVILVFLNVILRYVFKSSSTWIEEAVRYLIIWVTFIGSAVCFRKSSHMGIDLIFSLTKGRVKKGIEIFGLLASLAFMGFLFKYGLDLVLFTKETGQITPAIEMKLFWIYLGIPLGAFLSGIDLIKVLVNKIKEKEEPA